MGMRTAGKFGSKQESLATSSMDARMGAAFRTVRECDSAWVTIPTSTNIEFFIRRSRRKAVRLRNGMPAQSFAPGIVRQERHGFAHHA